MNESLVLGLPNGKACHFTSTAMRTVARYLRWETFKRGQYSHVGFELQVDDTVIDIGANIGMFALWAEPQISRGRLICIEPNPYALECLRMNIRRNDLRNVTVIPAAVGDEKGTMELVSHRGWEAMAHNAALEAPWLFNTSTMGRIARCLMQRSLRHAHPTTATKRFVVQSMPLSRILEQHDVRTVNFLKIDCEGSEYEVLRSLDAANWARILRVVIEYHDIGGDRNHVELVKILRSNGFDVEAIPRRGEPYLPFWASGSGWSGPRNLRCIRTEQPVLKTDPLPRLAQSLNYAPYRLQIVVLFSFGYVRACVEAVSALS